MSDRKTVDIYDILDSLAWMVVQHATYNGKVDDAALSANEGAIWVLKNLDLIKDGKVDIEALERRDWGFYHDQPVQWSEPLGDPIDESTSFDAASFDAALKAMYSGPSFEERLGKPIILSTPKESCDCLPTDPPCIKCGARDD